jgi:outer membrane biosynthesis protein TonB
MNQFKDTDLREALRRKHSDTPQLPTDFMTSMKQRMEEPKPAPKPSMLWRWMAAAACLLLIIGIGFTLWQKQEAQTIQPQVAQKIELPQTEQPKTVAEPETVEPETVQEPQVDQEPKAEPIRVRTQPSAAKAEPKTELAKAEAATEPTEEIIVDTPPAPETDMAQTLTERDIPITRPENYKYTPEELALLKKQANEAYLKWVELELEISRYTLEQTAQK